MCPDWVEKYHTKGTSIKKINGTYYIYKATSKRVKGVSYPVSIQKLIGKITEEGLIKSKKIPFLPGVDKIILLGSITDCEGTDKKTLNNIGVIVVDESFYAGKLTEKEIKVIKRYYNYEKGRIWK